MQYWKLEKYQPQSNLNTGPQQSVLDVWLKDTGNALPSPPLEVIWLIPLMSLVSLEGAAERVAIPEAADPGS
jgi:hypothetical protein